MGLLEGRAAVVTGGGRGIGRGHCLHLAEEVQGLGCHTERDQLQGHESGQDHLAIYLHNGNEYLEAMLGSFKARVAHFNVNYRYVAEELQYLLNDSQATAIVVHSQFTPTLAEVLPDLPQLRVVLQVDDESGLPLLPGAVWYEDALAEASAAALIRAIVEPPAGGPPPMPDAPGLGSGGE